MREHKNHSEDFEGLTFAEQAKSLNASVINLKKGILAHKRRASEEDKEDASSKYVEQLKKLVEKLS